MMNFNRAAATNAGQKSSYCPFIKLSIFELTKAEFEHRRTERQSLTSILPGVSSLANQTFSAETYLPTATGIAAWEISTPSQSGWLNWDWAVLSGGIIALVSPADIRSNLVLLDRRNHLLSMHDTTAMLAATVYQLPWREHVEALLGKYLELAPDQCAA